MMPHASCHPDNLNITVSPVCLLGRGNTPAFRFPIKSIPPKVSELMRLSVFTIDARYSSILRDIGMTSSRVLIFLVGTVPSLAKVLVPVNFHFPNPIKIVP